MRTKCSGTISEEGAWVVRLNSLQFFSDRRLLESPTRGAGRSPIAGDATRR